MITLRALIPQIRARLAFGSAEEIQEASMLDSMKYFQVAQARRIGRGKGPRGPQKQNKDSTRAQKTRDGYPDIPLVREKVLSDPREWRIVQSTNIILLLPPINRVVAMKHLKRLGKTFGMSRHERDNIRKRNSRHMSEWKLSHFAAEKRIS